MRVRIAQSEAERARIFRFRYAVYIQEMGKQFPFADHAQRLLSDPLDRNGVHLFIEKGEAVIATLRINWGSDEAVPREFSEWYSLGSFSDYPARQQSFTSRMMVAHESRGSSAALRLIVEAYRIVRRRPALINFIHTTTERLSFFKKLGFREYRKAFVAPGLGERWPLVLILDDFDHLKACQSPLLAVAESFGGRHKPLENESVER
jgi:predicted GNAT family N-acyltransferase